MMKKRKLIFIIGQSGSGKDTVVNYLVERYGWNSVCSFTTRPIRKNEVNGLEHNFLTWGEAHDPDTWCQHRGLHLLAKTVYGGHHYFTAQEQLTHRIKPVHNHVTPKFNKETGNYQLYETILTKYNRNTPILYVIDEEGFLSIMQKDTVSCWLNENFDFELWRIDRCNKTCVEESRTYRDIERIKFEDNVYKYIIPNHYDIDYLYSYIDAIVSRMNRL